MKLRRIIAVLLVCVMCMPLLASCNNDPVVVQKPGGQTGNQDNSGDFVNADYQGEDFTFLVIEQQSTSGRDYYGGAYIDAEGFTGNKINDGVHTRNLAVEEKYKVNINQVKELNGDPAVVLQQKIMAGEFTYDVIYGWGYKMGACITENYFSDFYKLDNADFTKEYWSPSAISDLEIEGKLYLSMNDISMNQINWSSLLFYNKTLAENRNITTDFGSPYEMVDNGTWTYDKFLEMVKACSDDIDGDGKVTRNDVFGLLDGNGLGTGALQNCDVYYTKKNDDGSYALNIYSEKVLGIIDKVYDVYSNDKYVKDFQDIWDEPGSSADGFADQWEYARSFFATGHALFCAGTPEITNEEAFRNMEDEYGILPFPKYDTNQEHYNATIDRLASIFAIPSTVTRSDGVSTSGYERTGTILEYMAYMSNKELLPRYYDEVLTGQRVDTEEDIRMMDLIRSCVRYEFADMVSLTSIAETVEIMFEKPTTAASTYNRNEKKMINEIEDFYTEVILLD